MLLIDYLEDVAAYLQDKRAALRNTEMQYRRAYDPDLKKEASIIKQAIRKKEGEVTVELLLNLEEFQALHKYFPELLKAYMEDENVGRVISKKAWLLDFKNIPPAEAAKKLAELRAQRAQLKDARKFLKSWVGRVQVRSFVATYPILKKHMTTDLDKDEVLEAIGKADKDLLKQGWLLLISESLIQIPLNKFMMLLTGISYQEGKAREELRKATGRGTVAEANANRKLKEILRNKEHYENVVTQLLLANPSHLKLLKKKKNWLSREKASGLERFAKGVTPHSLRERAWLNEMRKRLDGK